MSDHDYPPNNGQAPGANGNDDDEAVTLTEDDLAVADEIAAASTGEAPKSEHNEKLIADLNDRYLRLAAELENTRRRAEREKAEAGRYAIANFARDLLGVADNFERALHAAGNDEGPLSTEALSGIVSGLRMTEKELLSVLERHGVKRISPAGEKFDPNLHQAVAQIPGGKIAAGHVVDVAQPGFTIGERVLRAAMVTVSSGISDPSDDGEPEAGAHVDTSA